MIDEGRDGSVRGRLFLAAFIAKLDGGCCDEVTEDEKDSEEKDRETSDDDEGVYEPVFTIVQVQFGIFGLVFGDEFHGASCSHGFILCRLIRTSSTK